MINWLVVLWDSEHLYWRSVCCRPEDERLQGWPPIKSKKKPAVIVDNTLMVAKMPGRSFLQRFDWAGFAGMTGADLSHLRRLEGPEQIHYKVRLVRYLWQSAHDFSLVLPTTCFRLGFLSTRFPESTTNTA
jgi:hypothetical protein